MKHMFLTFAALAIISSIASYTLTHTNRGEVDRLRGEHEHLEERNEAMRRDNEALERQVIALRDDPRLAERRARHAGGLAKPHEQIYQFKSATRERLAVEVKLRVSPRAIELAGKPVKTSELASALDRLAEQVPHAELSVVYDEALGPIARQRIEDLIAESALAHDAPPAALRGER